MYYIWFKGYVAPWKVVVRESPAGLRQWMLNFLVKVRFGKLKTDWEAFLAVFGIGKQIWKNVRAPI